MKGLKIYACSGFGGVGNSAADYRYWLDNTSTITNTRAVNGLLSSINLLFSDLQYKELSDDEIKKDLNLIDLYVVCLKGAERYSGDISLLARWGGVVNSMSEEGMFDYTTLNNEERDIHLDILIHEAEQRMDSDNEYTLSDSFGSWYEKDVLDEDWNGIKDGGALNVFNYSGSGISGTSDAGSILSDAGYYFFGTYFSDAQVKRGGKSLGIKVRYERDFYQKAETTYSSLYSKDAFARVIYTGCQNSLKRSPERAAESVCGSTRGVGSIVVILQLVVKILSIVLPALTTIVTSVVEYFKNKNATTISKKDINNSILDKEALESAYQTAQKNKSSISLSSGSSLLVGGLLFGLIYNKFIKK